MLQKIKTSFDPIVSKKPIVLVLGSMPGDESLRKSQYYAYERNSFWSIMFDIFNHKFTDNYNDKKKIILDNSLALWDVLSSCTREGSLDSNIKNSIPNDIETFLNNNNSIEYVVFNGKMAHDTFIKHFSKKLNRTYKYVLMPSTSPANATFNFEDKKNKWQDILYMANKRKNIGYIETPIGKISILTNKYYVTDICIGEECLSKKFKDFDLIEYEDNVLKQCITQMREYFNNERFEFDVSIKIEGTTFQEMVYDIVSKVPYGKTSTYKDVATKMNVACFQAVGQVLKINRLPIIIPCHRIISTNGTLNGYMGKKNNAIKEYLLNHERK